MLKLPSEDGETAYNTESASIERYDGGFLVVSKNTGARDWHPDGMVRKASWVKEAVVVTPPPVE
jgi:hypothetical protein